MVASDHCRDGRRVEGKGWKSCESILMMVEQFSYIGNAD